jgi:DNA-binding PadR family transcriptional regulator
MSFVDRLKKKVQRDNLWFFILILLSSEPRYGYELRQLVKDQFGFWSGNVTAYRVLYSLASAGSVKSEMRERRKYYTITDKGKKDVESAREFLESILASANAS